MNEIDTTTEKMYCYRHPDQETRLRCNRCNQPICPKCAIPTPTGYRCPDCVRSQQKIFETAEWIDYPLTAIIAGVLSYLGSIIAGYFGFFIIFIAPIAGFIIAEAVRLITKRRRSKLLFRLAAIATAIGSLPLFTIKLIMAIMVLSAQGAAGSGVLLSLLWPGIYTIMVTSSVYYRLSGINIQSRR